MRTIWRTSALMMLTAWSTVGCAHLPNLGGTQAKTAPTPTRPLDQHIANAAPPTPPPQTPAEAAQSLAIQADTHEQAGRPAEAIATLERLRQFGGDYALYATRKLAHLYDRTSDIDRAEQQYQALLQHNKQNNIKDANLLYRVGDYYYRRGHWGTAEKYLSDAAYLQPNHADATFKLGLALAQNGDYAGSLEELAKVQSKAEAYCNIALVLNTQGKRADAIEAYQAALGVDATMARAQSELIKMGAAPTPIKSDLAFRKVSMANHGAVEVEERSPVVAQAIDEGRDRLMSQRATLPPLPDLDLTSTTATSRPLVNRKSR